MNTAQPAITGFRRQRVTALRPEGASTACLLADGGSVLISPYVAGFIAAGRDRMRAVTRGWRHGNPHLPAER
jgi:hypothetical protein